VEVCLVGVFLIGPADRYLPDVHGIARDIGGLDVVPNETEDVIDLERLVEEMMGQRGKYIACPLPPGQRALVVQALSQTSLTPQEPLLHPTSSIDTTVSIKPGSTVNRLVAIGALVSIGSHVHVNRHASIGHHTSITDLVTVGPGVTIASKVTLDPGAFVGAGAVILPGIHVGKNAVVGAGAVVTKDVDPNTVVVGNPARVVREGNPGFGGFSVA
jgi:sugar O-acyltransferase (sialic acid O-acetyltransferase NeuD family)